MPLSTNDILKVSCKMLWDGVDDIVNVFHFKVTTVPTPNTADALLEDIAAVMAAGYSDFKAHIPNNVTADVINVYNVTTDGPMGQTSWGAGFTGGTGTGEAMPTHDAMLALYSTVVKRRVGRNYFGPFLEASGADSRWLGTPIADVGAGIATIAGFAASINGTEAELGVYSRASGAFSSITTIRIQTLIATQRRRKLGRGS